MTRDTQRWVEVAGVAALLAAAYLVFHPFLVPAAWAGLLAYATWPLFARIERWLGGRTLLAAVAATTLMAAIVLVPLLLLSLSLARELAAVPAWLAGFREKGLTAILSRVETLPYVGRLLAEQVSGFLADAEAIDKLLLAQAGALASNLAAAAGDVGRSLLAAAVVFASLFAFYRNGARLGPMLIRAIERVGGPRASALLAPLGETVRAVLYGMLLTAPAQGLLALVGYAAVALETPVLLAAITTVLALTPIGAPIVYVPASLWLFLQGRPVAGIFLIAWGGLVVSTSDNLIRSSMLSSGSVKVPFLLGLFGVIGGVAAFGSIGLFAGPMVVTLLIGLVRALAAPETPPAAS